MTSAIRIFCFEAQAKRERYNFDKSPVSVHFHRRQGRQSMVEDLSPQNQVQTCIHFHFHQFNDPQQ